MLKTFFGLGGALRALQDHSVFPNRADRNFRSADIDSPDGDHVIFLLESP
jgi:hypothetical protein